MKYEQDFMKKKVERRNIQNKMMQSISNNISNITIHNNI